MPTNELHAAKGACGFEVCHELWSFISSHVSGPSFGRSVVFAFDFDRHALIARLHSGIAHIVLAGSSKRRRPTLGTRPNATGSRPSCDVLLTPVDSTLRLSQPDADRDPREKARMFDKVGVTRERLAIGRSTAGLPRTYRTLRSKHRRLRDLLRETVSACGALLKSVVVRF